MEIFLDIETVPTKDPEVIADIASRIKHPGNMSKPETIAKWEIEDKPALIKNAVAGTSFDGTYGSIVCIGFAINDEPVSVLCGADEFVILNDFYACFYNVRDVKIIGHNVTDFDLRFLWQRLVINNIKRPRFPFNAKSWDERIGDTMKMWNPATDKRISLDKLCKALKVPTSKADMDGSMVAEYANAGRYDEIAQYCKGDVIATRACYKKMI